MFRKLFPRRPSHTAVVAYLALFLALGGGALAATAPFTGSDGKIHGCVAAKGTVAVLKPPVTTCAAGQSKIAWNQRGRRGLQGIQGLQGVKGDAGPGAISIPITHVNAGTNGPIRTVDGIAIGYSCEGQVSVEIGEGGTLIYVSGEKAENGTLTALNLATSASTVSASGTQTANLDVIATVTGTWVRIDLGGYYGGANGCNIWGLVIPGT